MTTESQQSSAGEDDGGSPTYEEMLPQDLPVLEEALAGAADDEVTRLERHELANDLESSPPASAMLESMGRLFRWMARLLFAHVLFERRCIDDIRDANERGTVVYAMESRSRLDYLYFNYAFISHDLPLARWCNGVILRPMRGAWHWIRGLWRRDQASPEDQMEALVDDGKSAFLFLERPRQDEEEALAYSQSYLYRLIRLQRQREEPIYVMPLLLVWEKRPNPRQASFLDEVFGTVQSPGFFRKIVHYFQTFWQSFLKFGQPMVQVSSAVNLRDLLREYPNADSSDASELLRARLKEYIGREQKVILGPTAPDKETICEEVLQRPELQEKIRELADREEVDEAQVEARARGQLREIAADPSLLTLKFFSALLSFVWYRIYDGFEIDEEGLEVVRQAAKSNSIVLVPSHKSHIDYLVLSYVFYHYGLMTPHIAAGVNLSFWPLGPLFRRAGAFFIRRSFRGEELYPVVFREYLIRLMEESYPVEFFIEGTRSRTGKLIKPKYGMLDMMVRAYATGRLESVKIVPISVGYEKIIEERSYRREILGEDKKGESLSDLLKTPKFLTSQKGRLYVEFDDPIDLGEYFDRYDIDRLDPQAESMDRLTVRLAHRIIYDINQITTVSPTALTSAVLLNNPARGLDRSRLMEEVGFLLHFLIQPGRKRRLSGALREALAAAEVDIEERVSGEDEGVSVVLGERDEGLEATIGEALSTVIDRALAIFEREGQLEIQREDGEVFYRFDDDHRLELAYYRNTLIQHFVPEGLLAMSLMSFGQSPVDLEALREKTHFLSSLFKYEWIYEEAARFDDVFERTLAYFERAGWVSVEDAQVQIAGEAEEIRYFRRMFLTFLEAYQVMAHTVEELSEAPLERDELVDRAIKAGRKDYLRGRLRFYESISKPTYKNALRLLEDWGAIDREESDEGRKGLSYALNKAWRGEKLDDFQRRLGDVLEA